MAEAGLNKLINPTDFEQVLLASGADLGGVRGEAFDAFAKTGLPHRRLEAWKWTDLRQALRVAPANDTLVDVTAPSAFGTGSAFEIDFTGKHASWGDSVPAGMTIGIDHDGAPLDAQAADHPLAQLTAALSPETVTIEIAPHTQNTARILFHRAAGSGARFRRVRLVIGEGARLVLLDSFKGTGDTFDTMLVETSLGDDASLDRYVINDGAPDSVDASLMTATLGAGAHYAMTALLLGGKASRCETQLAYDGPEARATIASAALLSAGRHADMTTHIDHKAEACVTEQVHKAVIDDRARGVFQGKFLVGRAGQKTDANMQANALLLADGAQANHKPELEIYADDVLCAHGSTAGALDDDALFYLRQRGLDERSARALLIEAFVNEALDEGADEEIIAVMKTRAAAWQGGRT